MNITEYRQTQSRIILSSTGHAPHHALSLDVSEQEALFDRLSSVWSLIDICASTGNRLADRDTPTNTEKWIGLKRWFLSHHMFITQLALNAFCLKEATRAADINAAARWTDLASRLRRGCGALFLYGIDFQPCPTLYDNAIRNDMPTAFSGFWIRERQDVFRTALEDFLLVFKTVTDDKFKKTPRNIWAAADARYHELHKQSMYEAVPDGKSLFAQYIQEHGKRHIISEQEFQQYDSWFCIDRKSDINRLDFMFQSCDLIERVVADLMSGHRLERPVLKELLDGLRATIVVCGDWAGPVPLGSRFYPKNLRGE